MQEMALKKIKLFTLCPVFYSMKYLLQISFFIFFVGYNSVYAQIDKIKFENLESRLFKQESDSIYIVNFWATWCAPCVKELPAFNKAQQLLDNPKTIFIFVSLDFPGAEERVLKMVQEKNIQGEVVMLNEPDANVWINKISKEWQGNIPATWFVKPKSNKRIFHIGMIESKEIIDNIHNLK